MKIQKENTVAVVVDIQKRLLPVMDQSDELLTNCNVLIKGLQELSVPIIATQQYTRGLGETVSEISSSINNFLPIEKTSFSCYDEPAFVEALEEEDAKNVLICGIESHVCVLQTAIDLKEAGYQPIVVFDCVSSRTNFNKQMALERFRFEGIMVTSYESILFELTKGAKAPEFKTISKLVK
ncbi:MAG: hydrolase [Prolixibacteraceae bacterium]|jgi:nicotinamidase-related amidase|nr:hydrolase [Prolixibacteraceae bacterium]